ncbi:low molecular weight phosphotyrosine protein phosphatase [Dyella sp. M7H15-1]|uniref:low molecular weight protein-tyrosine-phosphatase n=1 Tax=Dyella sp. M7H15-1 TaxID=2501295 RepID=UPI00100524A4|nr:low molecular weight protein-tyrosine-phosphatase [Dyella sp. M7H15-1]QAU24660.1 low molecular weight phosphotyrosine protein phosphatase [Dyella sp. M7H15-1]
MFKRILIVCVGNICRSPAAEYLFRERMGARGIELCSAGLVALVGNPMDQMVLQLLSESGVDGTSHRAHQLTPSMLLQADLVLGMEKRHVNAMVQLAPEARGKVYLLDKWLGERDVPDPYGQPRFVFDRVYEMIMGDVDSWAAHL